MSGVGRVTLWTVGGLLLCAVGGVWLLVDSLGRRLEPPCLDAVAPAPDGRFVRAVERTSDGWRVVYDDGLGLEVPADPRRIISALPGVTEMLFYLGAGDRVVARSPWCDAPPEAAALPAVRVLPFDAEGVLALRADLLVADRRLHRSDLGLMRSRVGGLLLLESSRSLEHLVVSMRTLATVLGTEEAQERQAAFARRARDLTARLAAEAPAEPPRVLIVAQWDPLNVVGPGGLLDDLVRLCGGVNVACDLRSDASGSFNEELVLVRRPALILTAAGPPPAGLRERWRHVPAVERGRILDASGDDLVRGGPRLLDGLERLAGQLGEAR